MNITLETSPLSQLAATVLSLLFMTAPVAPSVETDMPFHYRPTEPVETKILECQVAVYGGTPAGVTAAVQASRMGKKAILFSFNRHVGGMTSGGLTATDIGKKEAIGGLAIDFYKRLGKRLRLGSAWVNTTTG
ncbi:FAD-dependent oxidoreductase [Akkermansiaceae bacterium]|nr:FAD-dependent oxidoreductase [Akkermansiaceae bacterium]MDB4416905.1 FAD-dependent oxidoreductase [bacterium]